MSKTSVVLITLAVLGTLTAGFFLLRKPAASADALKDQYNQWKVQFKVNVGAAEDDYRFTVFADNLKKINAHNSLLGRSFSMGLNAFSHLTAAEFSATHLGLKLINGPTNVARLPYKGTKSVDWTPKLNPPKDQGQCGSCWAFSTVGSIEGAHSVLAGHLYQLSEQELVDCSSSFGNQGCNGGLMDQGFQYVVSVKGLATETEYPYTAADGTCNTDIKTRLGSISSFVDVAANSSDAFLAALAKQPISVAVEADTSFQSYSSGVINGDDCGTQLDHGVVAVGFDTTVTEQAPTGYIKVRNSWGASWGEEGYIRLGIQDGPGVCGIQMSASYPTL